MPTIYKPEKATYERFKNANFKWVYNTRRWRDLRMFYLMKNPYCIDCKLNNKLTFASEVHHIVPISSVQGKENKQRLGFDYNNLKGLCSDCHKKQHEHHND